MKIHKFNSSTIKKIGDLSLALGFFDGIHIGHQKIINKAIEAAKKNKLESAVMTFSKSPKDIIEGKNKNNIFSIYDKEKILKQMGVQNLIILDFKKEELQNTSSEFFVKKYLMTLGAKIVVCGPDYRFGKKASGTPEDIAIYSNNKVKVLKETMVIQNGEKVSSSKLKMYLLENNLAKVEEMLGRKYSIWGVVKHGNKIGRTIGFKTANIDINDEFTIKLCGVFAVNVIHNNKIYQGIANIGFKPTISKEKKKSLEVFMFEFDKNIYNHTIRIDFISFIRNEKKFNSVETLSNQIKLDIKQAEKILTKN